MPSNRLKDRARQHRKEPAVAEALLWRELRSRKLGGWKWRRQVPCGDFILDFYCADAALVVELDGPRHDDPAQAAYDARRTAKLEEQGLTVLRINNETLFADVWEACQAILAECGGEAPHPNPLPASREREQEMIDERR